MNNKPITSSACAAAVSAGSFAEPDDLGGLAHFLEHMLFMGSGKYPDENHFETIVQTDGKKLEIIKMITILNVSD